MTALLSSPPVPGPYGFTAHVLLGSPRGLYAARVTKPGSFGHNYFYSNPAVSSDLMLVLRYGKAPGAENGRPLGIKDDGFWTINDDYPGTLTPDPDAPSAMLDNQ